MHPWWLFSRDQLGDQLCSQNTTHDSKTVMFLTLASVQDRIFRPVAIGLGDSLPSRDTPPQRNPESPQSGPIVSAFPQL